MKFSKNTLILVLAVILCTTFGCGDNDKKQTQAGHNLFAYTYLKDTYFWYDMVPNLTDEEVESYASPEALLEELKYASLDKWSYISDAEDHSQLYNEGQYAGFGFGLKFHDLNNEKTLVITHIFKDSPAEEAGLLRGDSITAVNGISVTDIYEQELFNEVFSTSGPGEAISLDMVINGNQTEVQLSSTIVSINTVVYDTILETDSMKTGYFVFTHFLSTSEDELDSLFASYEASGVDSLIVDLRYNPGGRLNIAAQLASLIAGDNAVNEVFTGILHNNKYRNEDGLIYFHSRNNRLNLSTICFITSEASCSASELVINGLDPHITVYSVGETTCGKPAGMYGYEYGGKWFSFIEFTIVNSQNYGEYYSGIAPDIEVKDDPFVPFGDADDEMLTQALSIIGSDYTFAKTGFRKATGTTQTDGEFIPTPKKGLQIEINGF